MQENGNNMQVSCSLVYSKALHGLPWESESWTRRALGLILKICLGWGLQQVTLDMNIFLCSPLLRKFCMRTHISEEFKSNKQHEQGGNRSNENGREALGRAWVWWQQWPPKCNLLPGTGPMAQVQVDPSMPWRLVPQWKALLIIREHYLQETSMAHLRPPARCSGNLVVKRKIGFMLIN